MTDQPSDLAALAEDFARDVTARVLMCLEGMPVDQEVRTTLSPNRQRASFEYMQTLHAHPQGARIGHLKVEYHLGLDRKGKHLAVQSSAYKLLARRKKNPPPMIRLEYERDPHTSPSSHIHMHGESGLLAAFLANTGHKSPHAMWSLHIPSGGSRFRPCIEDFIEFLIVDCGVAGRDNWSSYVQEGRRDWRALQARAVIREWPELAIEILRDVYELDIRGELPDDRLTPKHLY